MNIPALAERNRERVLDAAVEVFAERGFYGAQVPQIATQAGVGVGTIYRNFTDKLALVNAAYARSKIAFMGALLEDFPFGAPPREQFGVFWRRMVAFAIAEPHAIGFLELHHHAPYLSDENRALELRALAPVAAFVAGATEAGVLRDAPVELLIAITWGAFVGLVKATRMGHLSLDERVVRQAEACCWDALRRTTTPPEEDL